jgi:DNA-directed RNA polymerase subunit M/transcription elongation factor TFIIS
MYKNYCKKCNSFDLFTEVKGNNTGLYCSKCGAWQQWMSKDDIRSFEHSKNTTVTTNNSEKDILIERLNAFVDFLDKTIDTEMTKLPLSNEDAIRKSSYCLALERDKNAIINILNGKDFNYV